MPTTHDFTGRVALVTGAAQPIGRAIAAGLLAAGARVHVADLDFKGLAPLVEQGAVMHAVDLAYRAACLETVQRTVAAEGRLDILVHAAGGSMGKGQGPAEAVSEADWHAIFNVNTHAAFWLCQAAAPVMRQAGYGRIVHIASNAGLRPALNGNVAYTSAKHALVGLTRQLSAELGPVGVTVNAIAVGFVLSGPPSLGQWGSYSAEEQQRVRDSFHTRRLGTPEDVAHGALFFAAEESGWIAGQVLPVDGGRS